MTLNKIKLYSDKFYTGCPIKNIVMGFKTFLCIQKYQIRNQVHYSNWRLFQTLKEYKKPELHFFGTPVFPLAFFKYIFFLFCRMLICDVL